MTPVMSTPASLKNPFSSATAHGIPFAAAPKFAAPMSSAAASGGTSTQSINASNDVANANRRRDVYPMVLLSFDQLPIIRVRFDLRGSYRAIPSGGAQRNAP